MDSRLDRAACNQLVGKSIRRLREAKGLSIRALAQMVGSTKTTVGRWETGESEVGVATAFAIAEALKVDLVTLLGPTACAKPPAWPFDLSDFEALFEFAATVEEAADEFREAASPSVRHAVQRSAERVRTRRPRAGGQSSEGS